MPSALPRHHRSTSPDRAEGADGRPRRSCRCCLLPGSGSRTSPGSWGTPAPTLRRWSSATSCGPVIQSGATSRDVLFDLDDAGKHDGQSLTLSLTGRIRPTVRVAPSGRPAFAQVMAGSRVVGLTGLEPVTSSLSGRINPAVAGYQPRHAGVESSPAVRDGPPVLPVVVTQLVTRPGGDQGRATDPIASPLVRRWPGSRVAGGHRGACGATRSALDAGHRRANRRASGRRLGGEWSCGPWSGSWYSWNVRSWWPGASRTAADLIKFRPRRPVGAGTRVRWWPTMVAD
jgi:hypothetical protein